MRLVIQAQLVLTVAPWEKSIIDFPFKEFYSKHLCLFLVPAIAQGLIVMTGEVLKSVYS